jgi:hypothetical protein
MALCEKRGPKGGPLRKAPKPFKLSERMVQNACLDLLEASPKVAFAWRQNTGAVKIAKRFVRFSFKGCSDILGMLVRWEVLRGGVQGDR